MSQPVGGTPQPSKAEELFNVLKKIAGSRDMLLIKEVKELLPGGPKVVAALCVGIKKLEAHGAIERIFDGDDPRGNRVAGLRFLKDQVSIPQGKRGRKPGSKTTKKEAPPSVGVARPTQPELPAPAPGPTQQRQSPVAKPAQSDGVVVFIDENQLIMSEKVGRKFDIDLVLAKTKEKAGENIVRVFIYCSEATENKSPLMAQNLFRPESSLVRLVKTGSQPGVVDRRIREDMELWSRIDFVSTVVLGTADGGPDFLAAIAKVKESGKKLILLKAGGSFNTKLRELADSLVDATTPTPVSRSFEGIIEAAKDGNFFSGDLNSRFLLAVVKSLKEFFKTGREAPMSEIVQHIQVAVKARKEFDVFTRHDLREALSMLTYKGRALHWSKKPGKETAYRLASGCKLLEAMKGFRLAPV